MTKIIKILRTTLGFVVFILVLLSISMFEHLNTIKKLKSQQDINLTFVKEGCLFYTNIDKTFIGQVKDMNRNPICNLKK